MLFSFESWPKNRPTSAVGYDFLHGPIDPPRLAGATSRMHRLE
jgi:hypothetical protein